METYRLKSKFVESDREFLIQTSNDSNGHTIFSEVYVDGQLAEIINQSHPADMNPEKIISLIKITHGEKKKELETLLQAYRDTLANPNPDLLIQLGTAFFYKRLFQEAMTLFAKAAKLDPENHQAWHYLGMAEFELGHFDEAVAAACHAAEKRPGFADYRCSYGEALLARGNYPEAINEFEAAIQLNLYYGDAYYNLGLALLTMAMASGDSPDIANTLGRALDSFKKASLIYTDYDSVPFEQAMTALQEGNYEEAQRLFLQVLDTKKENHRREFAGFYMKFVMQPEWATKEAVEERITYLEKQIKRNPTYVDLHAELSRCYLEKARLFWKKGIEKYRETIELSPSLKSAEYCLEEAEKEYRAINEALDRMAQKG